MKQNLIHLYINFRIWLLRLVGYQKFSYVNEKNYSAKYFDEVEIIWFNPKTGKKLLYVVDSNRKRIPEKTPDEAFFMMVGSSYMLLNGTNTGVFRLKGFNSNVTRL